MAKNTASRCEDDYIFPKMARLHFLIKARPLRYSVRKLVRKVGRTPARSLVEGSPEISSNLEEKSAQFQQQRWAFLEDIWDKAFHGSMKRHWPGKAYFDPLQYITKSYDYGAKQYGLQWTPESTNGPVEFPAVAQAYEYLASAEMCSRLTKFCGDGLERRCESILVTRAFQGSSIIAHQDSDTLKASVNFVIFVDGTGGQNAGGLGIWRDNEFEELEFEPENLSNSGMIYDMSAPFYHGFKPMRPGTFRWMMSAKYSGVEND